MLANSQESRNSKDCNLALQVDTGSLVALMSLRNTGIRY